MARGWGIQVTQGLIPHKKLDFTLSVIKQEEGPGCGGCGNSEHPQGVLEPRLTNCRLAGQVSAIHRVPQWHL